MKILLSLLFSLIISAQVANAETIDQTINRIFTPYADELSELIFMAVPTQTIDFPIIVLWLLIAAIVFTLYFFFINIRYFKHAIELTMGKYDNKDDEGEVSHFQALATALSGTVGLGNIAGVAVAISLGGPGATLWMILGGLLGMSSKFVECTLGVKYRKIDASGKVLGGPMYYLEEGLKDLVSKSNDTTLQKGVGYVGKFLGILFAVFCVFGSFGIGNMFQINQATEQIIFITGGQGSFFAQNSWLVGLVFAVFVGLLLIGGIKRIAHVTQVMVPFMCILYLLTCLAVILLHVDMLGWAFNEIIRGAFSPQGISGGMIGVMLQGFKRSTFSNEAGIGSAPIAHAAVKTKEPITEGIVSLLEPFIDTVVVCTMTALVIILSAPQCELTGISLTAEAFRCSIPFSPYIIAVAAVLFAFSTAISWSYYGSQAWSYLFGNKTGIIRIYQVVFCGMIIVGASMNLSSIVDISDALIYAMAIPNIIGMYLLAPIVKKDLKAYTAKLHAGEFNKKTS